MGVMALDYEPLEYALFRLELIVAFVGRCVNYPSRLDGGC
jgi:hypothetical protein